MLQNTPKLHVVYDFRDQPVLHGPVYYAFLFSAMALTAYFFMRNKSYSNPLLSKIKRQSLWVGIFASICFLILAAFELKQYLQTKSVYDNKEYSIVEGRVQDYKPLSAGGHGSEDFRVDSLYFSLNDYDLDVVGYNKAASQGGVIRPNLYVRIYYPTFGPIGILRLETE